MTQTMSLAELLARLRERRIEIGLGATPGHLSVSAPEGVLTDDLREVIRRHKAELLQLLWERQRWQERKAGER